MAGCDAVVVASHWSGEAETVRAALDAGVRYIALVGSRRRGAAVLDGMGLTHAEPACVRSPAGLWIGARTEPEIALSIMAEVVATICGAGPGPDMTPPDADSPLQPMPVASSPPAASSSHRRRWIRCAG